jgi:hypothetical protein
MAPPKTQSASALKQSVLSFASTKRTKSASSVKGQKAVTTTKKETTKEARSTTESPGRSDEELIESFSEGTDGPPPPKKQKVKNLDAKRSKSEGVISSRDSVNDNLEELDLKDQKWKRQYKGMKQEMKSMDSVRTSELICCHHFELEFCANLAVSF